MRNPILPLFFGLLCIGSIASQTKPLEIYVFENYNRGFVHNATIQLVDSLSGKIFTTGTTNSEGLAIFTIYPNTNYILKIAKQDFIPKQISITIDKDSLLKQFVKISLEREAGYIFDVTIAEEKGSTPIIALGLSGVQVELYNRTKKQVEAALKAHPQPYFQFTVKSGNHYTLLLRKEGYVARRIEIYVNVEGCILCVDGVDEIQPGVTDNISATGLGSLLANIELKKATLGKTFRIQNIHYDFDQYNIRTDAAKILHTAVQFFTDNPELDVELGSHTDARGDDEYNLKLSKERALEVVKYFISRGVDSNRISYQGYGESQIMNQCQNGIECNDSDHEVNRRTELKITGIRKSQVESWPSLERIITEEEFSKEMFSSYTMDNITKEAYTQADSRSFDFKDPTWKYYILLGDFNTETQAKERVQELFKLGVHDPQIIFMPNKTGYLVIAGMAKNKKDAEAMVHKLKQSKLDPVIREVE